MRNIHWKWYTSFCSQIITFLGQPEQSKKTSCSIIPGHSFSKHDTLLFCLFFRLQFSYNVSLPPSSLLQTHPHTLSCFLQIHSIFFILIACMYIFVYLNISSWPWKFGGGGGDTRVKFILFYLFEEISPLVSLQSGSGAPNCDVALGRVLLRKLLNFNLLFCSHPTPAQFCGGE